VLAIGGESEFLDRLMAALAPSGLGLDRVVTQAAVREYLAVQRPAVVLISRLLPDGDAFDLLGPTGPLAGCRVVARARAAEARLARHRGADEVVPLAAAAAEVAAVVARLTPGESLESGAADSGAPPGGTVAVGPGAEGERR
jgi:DNA-binding response OmpR family regulator